LVIGFDLLTNNRANFVGSDSYHSLIWEKVKN